MIDTESNRHLTRQFDIIPLDVLSKPVTIIGCGAIGSFLGLQLAKMGVTTLTLFDHDTVAIENLSNQFFMARQIDKNKAEALKEVIFEFTGSPNVIAVPHKYEACHAAMLNGIVIVAVDSMEARRMVYESIKEKNFQVDYIIDPRMSAEFFTMYVINPHKTKDQETYEKTLFSDSEGVQERCTAKSTVYTASLGAGLVTKAVKNILLKQQYPRITHWDIASCKPMQMWGNEV